MTERHSREGYYIVGEGLVDLAAPVPGAARALSAEADLRAFRFSRMGPKGRGLPEPLRRRLAAAMTMDVDRGGAALGSTIPAGYTYLGQFIDHDLTFDRSRLREDAVVPVADLILGRSPSLDLDALYGLGPTLTPDFYSGAKLRVGPTRRSDFATDQAADRPRPGFDLPRRPDGTARIPDARNDENLAVGQTHLAFIRFHNAVVQRLADAGVPPAQRFVQARETVVRHYQWMIRTDFLPRIVKRPLVDDVFTRGRRVFEPAPAPGDAPTMPVEFSVAAYRFGHSMVRSAYDWNRVFDEGSGSLSLLFQFSGTSGAIGGQPPRLPSNWIADFRRLYDFREAGRPDLRPIVRGRSRLQFARRIDTLLSNPLADLPPGSIGGPEGIAVRRNLAFRNLTRARMLQLATGQQMLRLLRARGVTVTALTARHILEGNGGADLGRLNAAQRTALTRDTPLWFYVLREAEVNAGRLAGVGGRIVAETFHRAMEGSQISILADPAWRPTLGPDPDTFRMVDLLLVASGGTAAGLNPMG